MTLGIETILGAITEGNAVMPDTPVGASDCWLYWDRHPEGFRKRDRRERLSYDTDDGGWAADFSDVDDDGHEYGHDFCTNFRSAALAEAWLVISKRFQWHSGYVLYRSQALDQVIAVLFADGKWIEDLNGADVIDAISGIIKPFCVEGTENDKTTS